MRLLVRPAWRFIPETVTVEDIEELICAINQELAEVQEALIAYRIEPTEKNLAHIGEELADVVTRAATCFAAIETMPNCPAESFTEHCLEWVFHKNKARGYLDKRGKSDEPAAEDAEEV